METVTCGNRDEIGVQPDARIENRHAPRIGSVGKFFQQVAESIDFKQFEPREFVAERDKVVVLGFYHGVARTTGRSFKSDWVMVFTVRDGKIVHFREYADAGAITAAF